MTRDTELSETLPGNARVIVQLEALKLKYIDVAAETLSGFGLDANSH